MSAIDVNGRSVPDWSANPWHRNIVLLTMLSVFLAVVLTLSGAFDTDDLGLAHRLGLWLVVSALMVFQPIGLELVLARVLPDTQLGRWAGKALAILISIPVIAVELHALKFTPILPKAPDPWVEFIPFVAPPVLAIGGFTFALRLMWERAFLSGQDPADTARADPHRPSRATAFETGVLWVRARDHYLEIITDHGRHFRRDRLADWIERLNDEPGLQVHRSWWVADRAVSHAIRDGRDYKLVLSTGEQAPVARSRLDGVRARGWLDRVRSLECEAST
ncbi:LytTR family DNA-binding domain-containing protein [Oceanicaulis sp. MMSF_3324]|uniref:LytTR family DNA-binding domain-containing protein n=1 Tax=Oceanicaulis sp. MMSF_3324 TaxID=3046702 RepID=UPI00273EA7B4|nr:LytTR family DNA-binding domain-containing protein [Oceanicaulis sp. MMSF_3324]